MVKKLYQKLFSGVRRQMVLLFMITVILTALACMYVINPSMKFLRQMDGMFRDTVFLQGLAQELLAVDTELQAYLTTRDSDSLLNFYEHIDSLNAMAGEMKASLRITQSRRDLLYSDIAYMIGTYINYADDAASYKRGRLPQLYINSYARACEVADYIGSYIDMLGQDQLGINAASYTTLSRNMSVITTSSIIMLVSVILFNIFMILYITANITHPIKALSDAAGEIAKGNFDADEIRVSSNDEFTVMAGAFNQMKRSIKEYVEQLHDKADTEARLANEMMQNLRMKTLLNDAELKALQSQINPHFLFNTINAGMQLATMEGAEKTAEFIDNLASLFRYNVRTLDRTVTLSEELRMVDAYQQLFNLRYGGMRRFEFNIDENALDAVMPPLIVQPLVENAYIHGLSGVEYQGVIMLSAGRENDVLSICISDNGIGMDSKTIDRILSFDYYGDKPEHKQSRGHLTGIGIDNVVARLRMFFGVQDVIDIQSSPGRGTRVTLKIPYRKGG